MSVKSGDKKSVLLLPLGVIMEQPRDMTLFSITESILVNLKEPREGIRMTIRMKRKIMSEMMTTYFPSLLLMLITYATTFFKPFFFEAALSVNLTTMLVMTTIFISKMESLPLTSATKMIDYWLILCQLVPFAQVVLLTAKEFFREEEGLIETPDTKEDEPGQAKPVVCNMKNNTQLDIKDCADPKEAWVAGKNKTFWKQLGVNTCSDW